jgi:hypothetical protein
MTEVLGFMAQHGARLVDNGWPIIPIWPGSKVPGRYTQERWEAYPTWQRHCDRPTKPFEVDIWRRWPGCAVGIACGNVVGIDIDVTLPEVSIEIERIARRMLGDTPLLRIGRAPKRLLVYRAREAFDSIQFGGRDAAGGNQGVQVLAKGRQFLAYAIHPETQRPYEWPSETPLDVDLSDVPEITADQARAFLDAAVAALPAEVRTPRMPTAPEHVASGRGQRGTREAIESALRAIPNDDLHYDDWIAIGLALKGALGDDGRDLWLDFSARSKKDDDKVTARKWDREFRAPKAGAGTIYWLAGRYGWVPDAGMVLDGDAVTDGPHPAAAFLERINRPLATAGTIPPPAAIRRGRVPVELMHIDGLLAAMVQGITRTAVSPQPFLALGASLACLGALMGRRYRSPTGLRSNLYTVGIADSGGGKDHARKWIKEALFAAGLASYLGGNKIASGQAVLSSLTTHAARLFQLDEFGHFLAGVLSRKAPAHRLEIWSNLTELYTSADGWFHGTEYANQKDRPRSDISQPTCCVHATTVPGPFWRALEGESVIDGSLARWLIFRTDEDYPALVDDPPAMAFDEGLLETLRAVSRGAVDHDYGGNMAMLMTHDASPTVYPVPYGDGVSRFFRDLKAQEREWLLQSRGSGTAAIIARFVENAIKVAMIAAVSADPGRPVIRMQDARWAAQLVEHCITTTLDEADRFMSDNEVEAKHKKVLEVIRVAGRISRSDFVRKTQYLQRREREEIIAALIESSLITQMQVHEAGRKPVTYLIAGAVPEAESSREAQ